MSVENELKILPREEIKPEEIIELLEANGYKAQGSFKKGRQEDTYYDDEKGTLNKNNCSFRIRRKNNGAVVTYKAPIESDTEYKQREEMEVEIPQIYVQADGTIFIEDAIDVLRKTYPNVQIPEDIGIIAKVTNNRNKVNITSADGTVIELSFDDLSIKDRNNSSYKMRNELEAEIISGNPETLNDLYRVIRENYEVEKNPLSKYSRAVKEMNEQRNNMSLDDIVVCTMLSKILNTVEFDQLKRKGQIIHDYRKDMPSNLNLDNFKDPNYLIGKISEVRRTKNYKPGKIKSLEDMFLCFFSDMDYPEVESKLVHFLNRNYYSKEQPITNRMLHSQQVMLVTGLISKSKQIPEEQRKPLLCTASALVHDIGHVPGAHPTEEVLGRFDGFFSHEINGRNVIERIISQNQKDIVNTIKQYYSSIGQEYDEKTIVEAIQRNKAQIKKSIEAHSRTNSEKRGEGTVVQLPREADKIAYAISDIVDIKRKFSDSEVSDQIEFFSDEWKQKMIKQYGKGYKAKEDEISNKIDEIQTMLNDENYGRIITNVANTIRERAADGNTYYDVEQDTWDLLVEMTKYVKKLRKEGVIDNKRRKLQNAATIFTLKIFNENVRTCGNDIEKAWEKTLEDITKSNDTDILDCVNAVLAKYKNSDGKITDDFKPGGMLDDSIILQLDNSDRQIKMQPEGQFEMSDLLPCLGSTYTMRQPENILDTYFNKQNGASICVRENAEAQTKSIIVKKNRNKAGVTQVERERYVTTGGYNTTIEELVEMFNSQYQTFNLEIPNGDPRCIIRTVRTLAESEQGIAVCKDRSEVITAEKRIQMPETIEIECSNRNLIKKAKQQISTYLDTIGLTLKGVTTKESKEEQALRLIEEQEQER